MSDHHVQVRQGKIAQWIAPREGCNPAYEVFAGEIAQVALEVVRLPADTSVAPRSLRAVAQQLDVHARTAISFRFLLAPQEWDQPLRLFVVLRAAARSRAEATARVQRLASSVENVFARDIPLAPLDRLEDRFGPVDLGWVRSLVEVRRTEMVAQSGHDPSLTGFGFSYSPVPLGSWHGESVEELWRDLATAARVAPLMVEFTFTPTEDLAAAELDACARLATQYDLWGRGQTVEVPGGVFSQRRTLEYAPDVAAAAAADHLRGAVTELTQSRNLVYAIRLLSGDAMPPVAAAEDLVAGIGASDRMVVQPIQAEQPVFARCLDAAGGCFATPSARADIWVRAGAPEPLARLHRLLPAAWVPAIVPIPSVPVGRSWELFRARESEGAPPATLSKVLDSYPRWSGSSESGLEIPFGWSRDARPDDAIEKRLASLAFGDRSVHGLLGGKTGSGKSVLLHDVIVAAAHRYSPDELSMYLIDLKQGVEFKVYERLPHARVLAMGGEEEFTVNVLAALVAEMNHRNDLFHDEGVRDFESYRRLGGDKLPRILLVIDEFQTLFDERGPGDPLPREAVKELERVATKGRSAGVHMLLSTQSYTWEGGTWLSDKTQANATIRVAMQLADTRQAFGLLTKNPEAVEQLEVVGEGLLEDPALHPERPLRFRALYESSSEEYETFLKNNVADLATTDRAGTPRRPHVFEGRRRPEYSQALSEASRKDLVFGQSLDAYGSHVGFQLEGYSQAAHVMLCGERQDELGRNVLGLAVQFLQRHGAAGGKVLLGNAYAFPPDLQALIDRLVHWAGDRIEVAQGELRVAEMLQNCAAEIEGRLANPADVAPPLLIVPFGFNNLSCLNSSAYPPPPERELFSKVLRTGPAARVFLLGATTSWDGASGLLQPEEMGTFGARVALTPKDAARVVNAFDAFIDLPSGYAVASFPVDSSRWVRFRTFSGSGVEQWLRSAPPLTQGGSPHV